LLRPHQNERDVLLDLIEGSESAFKEIYQLYSPRLYGKLLNLVKSESQAKEILQDVFLKVWEHRKSIDPEKSFHSFLFKIAENKAYDFFRKAARDKNLALQLIASSTVEYNFIEEFKTNDGNLKLLEQAIGLLPPQRQQIFRLCKLDGKSYKEVGEQLSISVSTISDHIVKGTKFIREYFEKHKNMHVASIIFFLSFINSIFS
jgi:RNA polymerase sigma-70 factor (family 1)